MQAGQMVLMPAGRRIAIRGRFEDAGTVLLDRSPNRHTVARGRSSPLCRRTSRGASFWSRSRSGTSASPDYHLDTSETITEHGWQCGPDNLPLAWP